MHSTPKMGIPTATTHALRRSESMLNSQINTRPQCLRRAWHRKCLNALRTSCNLLPFQRFQVLFHSLFKVLFIFPSRYLFAIGLSPIFSFRRNLPPTLSCSPKQPDSSKARTVTQHRLSATEREFSPSVIPCSKGVLTENHARRQCFYRLQFGDARLRR